MSTALEDMQFEILPTLDAVGGVVFGIGADVSITDGGFLPGDDDWLDQDSENPIRGGVAFGRDVLAGPSWGWNLHVNRSNKGEALETLAAFKTAWRARHLRNTPGAVLPIRYRLEDRYRRIYGRPRRLAAPPDNLILSGYVPVTVDFKCVDSYTYDDLESVVMLGLTTGSQGGFRFPTKFPAQTLPVGLSMQQAVVGGDAPTYPVVRFTGPVTNPSLTTPEWTLSLAINIPAGEYVEVDMRPWARTALLNGTSSVAGKMGRRQYLPEMFLEPGRPQMVFRGASGTASATCAVRWSNAWNSI